MITFVRRVRMRNGYFDEAMEMLRKRITGTPGNWSAFAPGSSRIRVPDACCGKSRK